MTSLTRKRDPQELRDLQKRLEQLSTELQLRYEPVLVRLGCMTPLAHAQAFRLAGDQGTGYSLIISLDRCLRQEPKP